MSTDISADAANLSPAPEEAATVTATGTAAGVLQGERFAFTGTAREFFGIWIVNLLLTVCTVGIYSAWAKVRTRKYFYGHTTFAGERFDYHAKPIGILIGRLIAAALLGVYLAVAWLAPGWELIPLAVIFLATPWLLLKGAAFNARNSSYRNVRFGFQGSLRESYGAFVGWPVLGALSLGFAMPYALQRQARWRIGNHRFGNAAFQFTTPVKPYYGLYFKSMGLVLAGLLLILLVLFGTAIAAAAVSGGAADAAADGAEASPAFVATLLATYAGMGFVYAVVGAFFVARSLQIGLGRSALAGHRFSVGVRAREIALLYLTNTMAILFTLGLAVPWAKIRSARYQLERIALDVDEATIRQVVAERSAATSAVGQEVGDAFDVEFDFGI